MAPHPPHARQRPRRVHEHHGSGLNGRIALAVTRVVGTMWVAYAFALVAFVGLPAGIAGGPGAFVQWLSSNFIQLVLLPLIIAGQNIQGAAADERADATFRDVELLLEHLDRLERDRQ